MFARLIRGEIDEPRFDTQRHLLEGSSSSHLFKSTVSTVFVTTVAVSGTTGSQRGVGAQIFHPLLKAIPLFLAVSFSRGLREETVSER